MTFNNLCSPALIYLGFSSTQIILDTGKGMYNMALIKSFVTIIITIILNHLCNRGLGIISWFIVFIPFIFMSLIIGLLLLMFGLDPYTGKLKIKNKDKVLKVIESPLPRDHIYNAEMGESSNIKYNNMPTKKTGGGKLQPQSVDYLNGVSEINKTFIKSRILAQEIYFHAKEKIKIEETKKSDAGLYSYIFESDCEVTIAQIHNEINNQMLQGGTVMGILNNFNNLNTPLKGKWDGNANTIHQNYLTRLNSEQYHKNCKTMQAVTITTNPTSTEQSMNLNDPSIAELGSTTNRVEDVTGFFKPTDKSLDNWDLRDDLNTQMDYTRRDVNRDSRVGSLHTCRSVCRRVGSRVFKDDEGKDVTLSGKDCFDKCGGEQNNDKTPDLPTGYKEHYCKHNYSSMPNEQGDDQGYCPPILPACYNNTCYTKENAKKKGWTE